MCLSNLCTTTQRAEMWLQCDSLERENVCSHVCSASGVDTPLVTLLLEEIDDMCPPIRAN